MKELLNEFIRFSRMPTPKPKLTSLHKIIDDIHISYSEHEKKIQIKKRGTKLSGVGGMKVFALKHQR